MERIKLNALCNRRAVLIENEVTFDSLLEMDETDLKELGTCFTHHR
jgi:hypothetical protein